MIVDVFLFHDEFDMLRCRALELEGIVDRHIAIEGNLTMAGQPREYRLKGDEIPNLRVVQVDLTDLSDVTLGYDINQAMQRDNYRPDVYPYVDNWKRDWKQREGASHLIDALPGHSFVMYGDVDEIPRRSIVDSFVLPTVKNMRQQGLIYSTEWTGGPDWMGTVIGMKAAFLGGFAKTRRNRATFPVIRDAGWHLSWFGGREAVLRKVQEFAHGEMAEDLELLGKQYDERLWPGGDVKLASYEGDLPRYIRDGLAPASWENPE